MASPARVGNAMTLDESLRLPGIDGRPCKEFIDGRIETKMSPREKHGRLEKRLMNPMDADSEPRDLGESFPELRCTFADRSVVPDVVFLLDEYIEADEDDVVLNPTPWPPDIQVEIVSPDRSARKCRDKLTHPVAHGGPLGWLIDPGRMTVHVFRPGRRPLQVPGGGILEGEPFLPGYRLPVAELLGWVELRRPRRKPLPLPPGAGSPTDGGLDG